MPHVQFSSHPHYVSLDKPMSRTPSRTTALIVATTFTFSAIALYLYKNNKLSAMPFTFDANSKLMAFFFPATAKHIKDLEQKVEDYKAEVATLRSATQQALFSQPRAANKSPGSDFDDASVDSQESSSQKPAAAPEAKSWYSRLNPFSR